MQLPAAESSSSWARLLKSFPNTRLFSSFPSPPPPLHTLTPNYLPTRREEEEEEDLQRAAQASGYLTVDAMVAMAGDKTGRVASNKLTQLPQDGGLSTGGGVLLVLERRVPAT